MLQATEDAHNQDFNHRCNHETGVNMWHSQGSCVGWRVTHRTGKAAWQKPVSKDTTRPQADQTSSPRMQCCIRLLTVTGRPANIHIHSIYFIIITTKLHIKGHVEITVYWLFLSLPQVHVRMPNLVWLDDIVWYEFWYMFHSYLYAEPCMF